MKYQPISEHQMMMCLHDTWTTYAAVADVSLGTCHIQYNGLGHWRVTRKRDGQSSTLYTGDERSAAVRVYNIELEYFNNNS